MALSKSNNSIELLKSDTYSFVTIVRHHFVAVSRQLVDIPGLSCINGPLMYLAPCHM